MQRTRNILFSITLALNSMLLFLLLFENRIVLPPWLKVAGRMHPMILHFPIVLIILYVTGILFFQKRISPPETAIHIGEWLLLLAAFTSAVTALMGLFLSREEGYDADALLWHKLGGIAVSLIMLSWYAFRNFFKHTKTGTSAITLFSFAFIIFTGHQGAGITHGQNFLIAPILPEEKQREVLLEDAVVFTDMVKPILQSKCMSCHNSKKAKGDLVMETQDLLLKGGKTGKLWDSTKLDFGLLMKRIHLPLETKKHMPPQGKPQLSDEELLILSTWIKTGADFNSKVVELDANNELRKIAERNFTTIETEEYEFEAADNNTVKSLNNNYRIVYPLAQNSPALGAEFFNASQFSPQGLKELLAVKKQLVSLNLDKMQVHDEDLKTIGEFTQLRKLNLSFTGITGSTLGDLKGLKDLKQLSLSGTNIKPNTLKALSSLKQLTKLYVWNTGLEENDIKELQKENKELVVETGFRSDTIIMKLNPPVLQNEKQIVIGPQKLKLKHYINGVTIRYTLDGSKPDSLRSPVYDTNVMLNGSIHLMARAFKPGWIGSDSVEAFFYEAKYKPDSIIHLMPPDKEFQDDKNTILIDGVKGDNNFRSGKWVGFTKNKMEALMVFDSKIPVSQVSVGGLIDIGSYLMPPQYLEIWGGDDPKQLKLLNRITPQQPTKSRPAFQELYEIKFNPVSVKYLKIIAAPISKLPKWHPGKGKPGWFFSDEIFVN